MSAGEGTGDSLTVEDVVRLVLEQHPAIMQAAGTVDAADARVKLAESAWNPNVQVEASYTRLAPIAQLQFGPEEFRLFPADNFDAHIGLRQQLYDFGRTSAATELSRSRGQAARIGVNTARVSLAYQSIQTFYVILYLRAAIGVQQDQIRVLEEHRDVTQKKVTSGTATDFDVLTTEVRLGTARNQKIDLENAGHKAEVALARLIGREGDDPLLLTGSFEHVSAGLSADTLLHEAMAQRQEILAARSDQESARLQLQVAGLSERPSLNLGVSYGFKNGYMPNLDALRGNLAASVRIEVPVFEGGRGDLREEEAGAQVRSAEAHLTDTRMQIAQEVRQALSDLRSAVGKLSASELQLSQARQALTIARKRYEIGAISNLDLLDTESSLQQSNLLWLQSLYAVTANRFALSRAVGKEPWSHEGPK
jgi:outer membrane protein